MCPWYSSALGKKMRAVTQDVASRHVGHGKLFVASGLRRRVSRPHHICDTKLPDGAMELLRLARGMARGPIGPAGESARSG